MSTEQNPTHRVGTEDLAWAATWLGAYEGEDGLPAEHAQDSDDEMVQRARRIMEWLRGEVARREEDAAVRAIQARMRTQGRKVTTAQARAAIRRQRQSVA